MVIVARRVGDKDVRHELPPESIETLSRRSLSAKGSTEPHASASRNTPVDNPILPIRPDTWLVGLSTEADELPRRSELQAWVRMKLAIILDSVGQHCKHGVHRSGRATGRNRVSAFDEALGHALAFRTGNWREQHRKAESTRHVGCVSGDRRWPLSDSPLIECGVLVALKHPSKTTVADLRFFRKRLPFRQNSFNALHK